MKTNSKFEELIANIDSQGDVLTFLKALSLEEKKALIPIIKKLEKHYREYVETRELGFRSLSSKGSPKQFEGLCLAGYFCMDLKDFTKNIGGLYNEIFYGLELHKIYSPDWFSTFVNNSRTHYLDYSLMIKLYEAGYLKPGKQLIVRNLESAIYERVGRDRRYYLDNLYLNPITLKEHIWYLFSEESTINWNGKLAKARGTNDWISAFATLIERGDIDRTRILQECLKCACRNYDKILTGWFFDLLAHLQPSKEELILLQKDLLSVFNMPHTKPISLCLKYIKSICTDPDFLQADFLEVVPTLLSSETKGIVNSTLIILEKIAKKYPKSKMAIALLATNAFLLKEEKTQTRTANLIAKYGDKKSEELCQNIAIYHSELFSSVKTILADFNTIPFLQEEALAEKIDDPKVAKIREDNKIETYTTFEELIFFFSQVFENNEDHHFDLFLELLPRLCLLINKDNISQIEPAFLRASKTLNAWNKKIGYLEHFLANVFCNVIYSLLKKHPNQKNLNAICENIKEKNNFQWQYLRNIPKEKTLLPLIESDRKDDRYTPLTNAPNYQPFISRLIFTRTLCETNTKLPFLATPSHAPCWITMETFIEKLGIYQDKNQTVNLHDFQIGINRLVLDDAKKHHSSIQSKLKGEYQQILLYLIGERKLDLKECKYPSLWFAAIYRKGNPTELKKFIEKFDKYDRSAFMLNQEKGAIEMEEYETYEKKIKQRLVFKFKEGNRKKTISKKVLQKLIDKKEILDIIYHYFHKKKNTHCIHPQDDKKMIYISPFNPGLFLKLNIIECLSYAGYSTADNDRSAIFLTEALINVWDDFGELTYLQVARTLLYIKKPSRELAAELWIQAVNQDKMNNELLGNCLGRLESQGFLPLKRLTDLINDFMINISTSHNKALEIVVVNMLLEMDEKPIKGMNKLISLYTELIQLNKSKIHLDLQEKMMLWKKKS